MSGSRAPRQGGPYRIVVGVTGGIAAYKACTLVRRLQDAGADVTVIPTPRALDMVGRATWEALTGKPVHTEVAEDAAHVAHVRHGGWADAVVVAPATADTIAKMRAGMADNLLTSTLLAARCPILLAPAMHTEMWLNPATADNVRTLRERGVLVMDPASGRLTGSDSGPGRLPEPEDVAAEVLSLLDGLDAAGSFAGLTVAVSAGGTHEAVDPVRFLGNRSTGRFGVDIARQASRRGARAILVAANVSGDLLAGTPAEVRTVESAADMHAAMDAAAREADVVVMAAAVADYRPAAYERTKQKKGASGARVLELVENPDILADLSRRRRREGQTVVGFAAETGDDSATVWEHGRAKAIRKGSDLTVVNRVGDAAGFGDVDTAIAIVDGTGATVAEARGSKAELAGIILDAISAWRTH